MIEFSIDKATLISPLLLMAGTVDKKQSLPVLSNILFRLEPQLLTMVATDLEIEMTVKLSCKCDYTAVSTIPAKKLIDIVRSLDDNAAVKFSLHDDKVILISGRSRFRLSSLDAKQFPSLHNSNSTIKFSISKDALHRLLDTTYFAMSHQDVRIYLNGVLLELDDKIITAVATDGHRMAIASTQIESKLNKQRIIVPRKAVLEILRLLPTIEDDQLDVKVGDNHFLIQTKSYSFVSRLVESRFPTYQRVIPKSLNTFVLIERESFKRALSRITILAHEKSKALIFKIENNNFSIIASNQQQDEAMEDVEAQIDGQNLKIKMNAVYLIDVLQHLPDGLVRLSFVDADNSVLVESLHDDAYQYIIMPIKL